MSLPQITIVVPGRWHAFDFASELEQLGALHRLVTNYPKSRTRRWKIPDSKVISLPLTLVLTKMMWKLGGEKVAMRHNFWINDIFARRAARELGTPDLVHSWSGSSEPTLRAARSRGVSTVLERSSSHILEQCRILRETYADLGLRWEETQRLTVDRELREYDLVDRVFVPSLFVERSFLSSGYPGDRIFRNGFGVDLSRFTPDPAAKRDNVFRVVYAGSMSVRKGVHFLAQAFRQAAVPNSELLLIGGSLPETNTLLGSEDTRIRRVGHVPQAKLPALYRTGSVFAIASVEEGQAYVQAQALASGLPLVCTKHTGGEDFLVASGAASSRTNDLTEFPAGYLVPSAKPDALAAAFRELARDPELLAAKQAAARLLATRDLSWRRYAKANLAEYSRILWQRKKYGQQCE
jgi:starch synthase